MRCCQKAAARLALLSSLMLWPMAQPAKAEDSIKIGLITELSGKFAAYGVPSRRGAEMAIDAVGDTIAGHKIELVVRDTQSDPQVAVPVMVELSKELKLHYILGPNATPIVAAVIPAWRQSRPIWLCLGSSDAALGEQVGADPNFFHTYPFASDYHKATAAALRHYLGPGKTVAIIYTDGAFGQTHVGYVRKEFPEAGFKLVDEEKVPQNTLDMRTALLRIKRAKPDVLVALTETSDAVTLAKQAQIVKLNVPYVVGTAFGQYVEWQQAVGPAQEGWMGVSVYIPGNVHRPADPQDPALFPSTQDFDKAYRDRFHAEPDQLAADSFAATGMLLLAIRRAGGDDPDKVAAELRKVQVHTVVGLGEFKPAENGTKQEAFSSMGVFQRQHGTSVMLWPLDIASGTLEKMPWP